MRLLDSMRFRLGTLFRRSQMNSEMEEEIRSHIQLRADDLERGGLSRAEAERRARLEFGPAQRMREECQQAAGGALIESLGQDVRLALRLLRKTPGFTTVAVLTLAVAIGANAVVFAALNAVILKPLNVPKAESLFSIHRVNDNSGGMSVPNFRDMRARQHSFEDLLAYNFVAAALDTGGGASTAWGIAGSANYFDALGLQPHLGRLFHDDDDRGPNSAPYIVLAYKYWHTHFQDDPGVVGRVVQLNKHPFTIIGVGPKDFHGTLLIGAPDFFVPVTNEEQLEGTSILNARGNRWFFQVMGHVKPGVTVEQAAAEINAISTELEKEYPNDNHHATLKLARPSLYGDYVGRPAKAFLSALMALAGLILLAACANLGSLFAARAADRSREVALRLALGAGRVRILRQLFTEAILISLMGGVLGLWGSLLLLRWLSAWQPFPQFPVNLPITPDAKVYAVALLLAVVSGLLFGAVPVRQVLRTDPYEIIKAGARFENPRRISARDVLVVAQIAICAVLVTSSIVAVRGLVRSMHSDFGFEPRNVMLAGAILDMAGYRGDAVPPMQKRMIDSVTSIPGVASVGMTDWVPLTNGDYRGGTVFRDETSDLREGNAAFRGMMFRVSADYAPAAGTALLSGRNLTRHDDKDAPKVALINQEFARKIFGGVTNAIGGHFKMKDGTRVEVVGIVEDGKYQTLNDERRPALFVPIEQWPASESWLVVRSDVDTQQLAAAIRGKLRELDPGLPCVIETWNQALDLPLFPSRLATVSLGVLGIMGAVLSLTGIFGLAAYSVSRRMRELGIRMALGAQRTDVLQAALGRAFKLLAVGSVAGLLLGMLATRVLAFIVYEATPKDPVVLAGAVVVMALVGLLATWIPAQRALSADPLVLLREQ